jgi:hypothetical protein
MCLSLGTPAADLQNSSSSLVLLITVNIIRVMEVIEYSLQNYDVDLIPPTYTPSSVLSPSTRQLRFFSVAKAAGETPELFLWDAGKESAFLQLLQDGFQELG